jgi:transposase InsO family protein
MSTILPPRKTVAPHRLVNDRSGRGGDKDNEWVAARVSTPITIAHSSARDTREQLRIAIVTWIERTHHRRRRQTALGRLTPIEYETIMTTPATQAA